MRINIKEKLLKFKTLIKKLLEKYTVTMVLIYVITVILTFLTNTEIIGEEWIEKTILFLSIWTLGAFFTENIFEEKKIAKIVSYIVTAIISLIFTQYIITTKNTNYFIQKLFVCYISTLITTSLFFIIKKSEKDISEYILKVGINIIRVSFLYSILATGIAIILYVFNVLILEIKNKYIINIEILFFGLIYITKMIDSLINLDEEVSKFFKNLVKYILMPLVIAAFTIIYLYIIKILILREIPKNQIYRIALGLFIIGGIIWTIMQHFKDEGLMYKISLKLPVIFIPFIILQIYSIGVRIVTNGLTPARYFCVVFVIFEIIYILLYILKKEKLNSLLIIGNVLIIISVLIPKINMFDMSLKSQIRNLNIYKEEINYSEEEKKKILGAYNYLRRDEKGEDYIKNNLTEEDIEAIRNMEESIYNSYNYYNNYEYISLNYKEKIDISGYNTICPISTSSYNNQKLEEAFKNIDFQYNNQKKINANILNDIREYINNDKDNKEAIRIQINEEQLIIIYNMSIRYNKLEDSISSYNIEAYLLEK